MSKADELIELLQQACEDSAKHGFSREHPSFILACQRIREVAEVDHDLVNFLEECSLALEFGGIAAKIVGPKILFSDRVLLEANLCGGDIEYTLPAVEGTPFKESIGDIEIGHHFDEVKAIIDRNVYPRARTILLIPEPFHKNLPSIAPEDVAVPESLWVGRHSTYETNMMVFRSPNGRSRTLTPVAIIDGPFHFESVESYEKVVDERACRTLCRLWYESYGPCRDLVLKQGEYFLSKDALIWKGDQLLARVEFHLEKPIDFNKSFRVLSNHYADEDRDACAHLARTWLEKWGQNVEESIKKVQFPSVDATPTSTN